MSVEIEAHTVPDFKAPIYVIMEYQGLERAGTSCSKISLCIWAI